MARAERDARRLHEHAGLVRDAGGASPRIRPSARPDPGHPGAARRRVWRQVRAHGAARGRRCARAAQAGPAVAHTERGLPGDQPGFRPGDASPHRRPEGRDAHGDRGAHDRRPRLERGLGGREHHLAARRGPLPLGGLRSPRLRRADQPLHVRRLPRTRRADRGVRARVAPRRARRRARARSDRPAPEERRRRGRRRRWRQPLPRHRRRPGARERPGPSAVARALVRPGERRRRYGVGPLARWERARSRALPRQRRRHSSPWSRRRWT